MLAISGVTIRGLFECHLSVRMLDRAVRFYRGVLALPLAHLVPERGVAFFWIGSPGQAMLGLWEVGTGPQQMTQHLAFTVDVAAVLSAVHMLRKAGIVPLDIDSNPCEEPVVIAWMPAVAVYFHDPDGNLLEFLAMLPDQPRPDLGIMPWSSWLAVPARYQGD
jgi:lactoylglutathione lyase